MAAEFWFRRNFTKPHRNHRRWCARFSDSIR